jgi:hypothetical protein
MTEDDFFTAIGPGDSFAGFRTLSTSLSYGLNVQGTTAGIYAECLRQSPGDREAATAGVGISTRADVIGLDADGGDFGAVVHGGDTGLMASSEAVGIASRGATGIVSRGTDLALWAAGEDRGIRTEGAIVGLTAIANGYGDARDDYGQSGIGLFSSGLIGARLEAKNTGLWIMPPTDESCGRAQEDSRPDIGIKIGDVVNKRQSRAPHTGIDVRADAMGIQIDTTALDPSRPDIRGEILNGKGWNGATFVAEGLGVPDTSIVAVTGNSVGIGGLFRGKIAGKFESVVGVPIEVTPIAENPPTDANAGSFFVGATATGDAQLFFCVRGAEGITPAVWKQLV